MSQNNDPSVCRTLISIPNQFSNRMKKFAEDDDISFSALIREALKLYTNDGGDCFVVLAQKHAGSEAADHAAESLQKHNIKQSHFLGHIIREASEALLDLKEEQSWKDIKCTLRATEKIPPWPDGDPDIKELEKIHAQRDASRYKKKGKAS